MLQAALVGFAFVALAVLFLRWVQTRKPPSSTSHGGVKEEPCNDPVRGNVPDIVTEGSLHQYLQDRHARHGPLFSFHLGPEKVFSAASPDLFRSLSASNAFNRPESLFMLFQPLITQFSIQYANDEEGRDRHHHLTAPFRGESLKGFYEIFSAVASECIDEYMQVPDGQHVNVSRDMFHIAMKAITRAAFGDFFQNPAEMEQLRNAYELVWAEMERRLDMNEPSEERQMAFEENRQVLYDLVERCIRQRRESDRGVNQGIFLDRLLMMDRSDEENIGEAVTYLVGGFHTTGNLLVWALYYLSLHPEYQDRIAEEAQRVLGDDQPTVDNFKQLVETERVVNETLRCSTLAPWAARYFDEERTFGGCTIPAKTPIIIALGVVLHDASIWPEPHRFDPDRFSPEQTSQRPPRSFEAFGLSPRRCPGHDFAHAEARVVLAMMCRKFRFDLAESVPAVEEQYGLVTHPSETIEITLQQR